MYRCTSISTSSPSVLLSSVPLLSSCLRLLGRFRWQGCDPHGHLGANTNLKKLLGSNERLLLADAREKIFPQEFVFVNTTATAEGNYDNQTPVRTNGTSWGATDLNRIESQQIVITDGKVTTGATFTAGRVRPTRSIPLTISRVNLCIG